MYRILAVDDNSVVLDTLNVMIRRLGHYPVLATKGERGIKAFREHKPHLTILDFDLPDLNGLEVLKRIRALVPDAPVIMLTGGATEALEIEARQLGLSDFLLKGFSLNALKEAIDKALPPKDVKRFSST